VHERRALPYVAPFPYNRTYEGGAPSAGQHRPSLLKIDGLDPVSGIPTINNVCNAPSLVSDGAVEILSRELLDEFEQRLREVGAPVFDRWRPGLTDTEIDDTTASLGLVLPVEPRLWWSWRDGVGFDEPAALRTLGPMWVPLKLTDAIEVAQIEREVQAKWVRDGSQPTSAILWVDSWLPFCGDVSSACLACGCEVGAMEPSPVFYVDGPFNTRPTVARTRSMAELIRVWLQGLDDGLWHIDPKTGGFDTSMASKRAELDEHGNAYGIV
jgi:hypothetical protein